jgi:hypothetical protein
MARVLALPILPVACVLWCLIPAEAAPLPRSEGVVIHLQQRDLEARVGPISVYFNPKCLPLDKQVPWKKGQASEGDQPPLEFTAAEPKHMSFDLVVDLYERDGSPTDVVPTLEGLVDQVIPITWHRQLWMGKLRQVKLRLVKTRANGDPDRAVVTTVWSDLTPTDPRQETFFTADIPGAPEAATMIRTVSIDPVALPPDPNAARGRAKFVIASPGGLNPDLVKWQGDQTRRTITVTMFGKDGAWLRTYGVDAEPIAYAIDDPKAVVPYAVLEVVVRDVHFESRPLQNPTAPPRRGPSGQHPPLPLVGFSVTLTPSQGSSETAFFKSVSGLKVETEVTDYDEGGITASTRKLQGVTKWPNLVLVGPPTQPGSLFQQWVDRSTRVRPAPMTVTIAPLYLLNGKPYSHRALILRDVVPNRYVFPRMSGIWSDGDAAEGIGIPPSLGYVE